jgi:hypothetical protein
LGVLGELALHPHDLGGGLGAELHGGFVPAGSCEAGGRRRGRRRRGKRGEDGTGRGGCVVSRLPR